MDIYTAVMLMAPPGLDSINDAYEKYKHGSERIKSVFEDDTYYEQWVEMWKYLAEELKDFKGVAGYGLINQPRARVKVKVNRDIQGTPEQCMQRNT